MPKRGRVKTKGGKEGGQENKEVWLLACCWCGCEGRGREEQRGKRHTSMKVENNCGEKRGKREVKERG